MYLSEQVLRQYILLPETSRCIFLLFRKRVHPMNKLKTISKFENIRILLSHILCCMSIKDYCVLYRRNICHVICIDDIFLCRSRYDASYNRFGFCVIVLSLLLRIQVTSRNTAINQFYDTGITSEISFARFCCIIFLTASISWVSFSAHIAFTIAVSDIISDNGTTPISSKSLPVS